MRGRALVNLIEKTKRKKNYKIHSATKVFQALRIFHNSELEELQISLDAAKKIIKKEGIIVTIAFHSLEDNIIKNSFKPSVKLFPKDIPINNIEKRDRVFEKSIQIQYLKNLHLSYEKWIKNYSLNKILIIDNKIRILQFN